MRRVRKFPGIFFLLVLTNLAVLPGVARADSDGYFCTAKGYLAVEFRSFNTPGLAAKHVLKIIRFGKNRGIHWAGEISLPDFQTHYMSCHEGRVEIAGWGNTGMMYTIDVTRPEKLRVIDAQRGSRGNPVEGPEPPNLGRWSRPGIFPLESDDPHHTYRLVCTVSSKRVRHGIKHYERSEIIQINRRGRITQSFLIFKGSHIEGPDAG